MRVAPIQYSWCLYKKREMWTQRCAEMGMASQVPRVKTDSHRRLPLDDEDRDRSDASTSQGLLVTASSWAEAGRILRCGLLRSTALPTPSCQTSGP